MSHDRSLTLHVPRSALWLLGFFILAPWLFVGGWLYFNSSATPSPYRATSLSAATAPRATPAKADGKPSDVLKCQPGAWGDLEYFRTLIEPPEEYILPDFTVPATQPWIFKGYTPAKLTELWDSAALTPVQRRALDRPDRQQATADAITVRTDDEIIMSLSPISRAKIYTALSEFPENVPQSNPYRLRTEFRSDWLAFAELSDAAIALTHQMFYDRGITTCFSDYNIVLSSLPTPGERFRYVKALSRKSALIVQLTIAPGTDISVLDRYWGRGRRSKDITPILQSIARRPNGGSIDIIHLLPPFARTHLNTYPLPSDRPEDVNRDCHWASFNFFRETPDERFNQISHIRETLANDYFPVLGEPAMGDIIMLVRQDGTVVHSCVYIADNIVFTKNGPAFSVPWLLASLDSVVAYYAAGQPVDLRRYRTK